MEKTQVLLRLPDDLHRKARMIAAYNGESLNAYFVSIVGAAVERWESEHGRLPAPPATHEESVDENAGGP